MKDVKIQIRVSGERREEWKGLARESHKTLTQYIVDSIEGTSEGSRVSPVRPKVKKGKKELPSQEIGDFKTYFK